MKSVSKIIVPGALGLLLAAPVLAQNAPSGSQSSATSGPQGSQANATSESHTSGATTEHSTATSGPQGNQSSASSESRNTGSTVSNHDLTTNANQNYNASHETQRSVTQGTHTGTQTTSHPSMSHDTTMAIQRRLQQDGFYHGNVDGQWGPDTQSALSDFQRRNNLNATGQVDERTLDTLKLSSNEATSNTTGAAAEQMHGTGTTQSQSHSSSSSKTQ